MTRTDKRLIESEPLAELYLDLRDLPQGSQSCSLVDNILASVSSGLAWSHKRLQISHLSSVMH